MIGITVLVSILLALGVAAEDNIQYSKEIECSVGGPIFWCQNKQTAIQCHATSYCIEQVWPKHQEKAGAEKDSICALCEKYATEFHDIFSQNATRQGILNTLKERCLGLPSKSLQDQCIATLDKYGNMIMDKLNEITKDSKQFCSLMGFCQSSLSQQQQYMLALKSILPKEFNADLCTTCQQYVGTIHLLISNNASQAELIQALSSICTFLPSTISPECSALMEVYAPVIVNWLVDYTAHPINFCTTIGLCSSQMSPQLVNSAMPKDVLKISMEPIHELKATIQKTVSKPKNKVTCEVCNVAMNYFEGMLKENNSRAAVKSALYKLCGELTASLKEECTILVQEYADQIMTLIVDELKDTTQICKELGLCSTNKAPLKNELPQNIVTCELCQYAASYLDGILEGNKTESAIRAALEGMCNYLPSSFAGECKNFVDTYADTIIKLLVNELATPETLCTELGLCTATKTPLKNELPQNIVTCELCQYAASYLDGILEGNKTESAIRAALEGMCNYLPSSFAGECKNFVDTYADTIIKLLVNELASPETLCTELGLCAATKEDNVKHIPASNGVSCEICVLAMGYLDELLQGSTTKELVKEGLDKLCGYLPPSLAGECDSLVNQYSEKIIQLIVSGLAPSSVCKELGICTTSKHTAVITPKSVRASPTCSVCMFAMGELDSVLTEKSTEDEIKVAVETLCTRLPAFMGSECKVMIDTYGNEIITYLAQEMDASNVCHFISLCKAEKQRSNTKYMLAMRMGIKGVSCEVCEYAMGYLDTQLLSKPTEAEIKNAVEKICFYLPELFKNECDALITEYGDELITLIVNQIKPAVVCQELRLC